MPSPEHGGGFPPEQPDHLEDEPVPYIRVARFADEHRAARTYRQAEAAIHATPCDVSVYRFLINQDFHVAVIGAPPPPELHSRLEALLAVGEPTTLPPEVLDLLLERRRRASRLGPWVEGHYRPGERL